MRYALIAVLLLASCGADGPPEPPAAAKPTSGVTITGEARAGVVYQE